MMTKTTILKIKTKWSPNVQKYYRKEGPYNKEVNAENEQSSSEWESPNLDK